MSLLVVEAVLFQLSLVLGQERLAAFPVWGDPFPLGAANTGTGDST